MKTSINHILSFITAILMTIIVFFIVVEFSLRNTVLIKQLNNMNYYKEVHSDIISKVNDFVINEEINEEYKSYITKNIVKKDVNSIINNKNYDISHYDEFYNIISKYSEDKEICEKYAAKINNIYVSNIFPINEYKILSKLYISTSDFILYSLMLCGIIVFFEFIMFIINKNLKYSKISILSSSIIMLLPLIIINITNMFGNFIYTNDYYTDFLINIINNIKNILFVFGIIIIVLIMFTELNKKRK